MFNPGSKYGTDYEMMYIQEAIKLGIPLIKDEERKLNKHNKEMQELRKGVTVGPFTFIVVDYL